MRFKDKLFFNYFFRILNYYYNPYFKKLNELKQLKLNSNSIFIDIGGNRGFVSNYIIDYFDCFIDIYEPHPACLKLLKKKFEKNLKVKIFDFAVSDNDSTSKLYLSPLSKNEMDLSSSAASSLEKKKSNLSEHHYVYIKTINLEKILNKYKFIDVIKIDIEQHEYKILPILYKYLDKIDKIVIELHDDAKNVEINNQYLYWKNKIVEDKLWNKKFFDWL